MNRFNKILKIFLIIGIGILNTCTVSSPKTEIIKIKGSDSMLALVEHLAHTFMQKYKTISIYVEGGGTATGIKSLIEGKSDICSASRTLKSNEIKDLVDKTGSIGLSYLIAKDAISIYLNPENQIKDLTLKQIKDIYTGKIKNWKEIGGEDLPIMLISRSPNSGTYLYFNEHVLFAEPFDKNIIIKHSTLSVQEEVMKYKGAIGYGSIANHLNLTLCKIEGIEPSLENIINDKYPITRYLYFYILDTPSKAVKKFIDWCFSNEGQNFIKNAGYIPLWNMNDKANIKIN